VGCQRSGEALIIDPERDIDRYKFLAKENGLRITAVAETHIHANFVSGAEEFVVDPDIHLYLSGEGGLGVICGPSQGRTPVSSKTATHLWSAASELRPSTRLATRRNT
jgi:hypothetical protein